MPTTVQIGGRTKRPGAQLDPALKEFLDAVVIPALVKEYLSEHGSENRVALAPQAMTQSVATFSASAEGVQ